MLSGVLTKPPILSTKIFTELVNDLAINRDRFSENKDLKRFLSAKYFKNLRQETLDDIFKKIWKLVFKLENDECDLNREINFRTLNIIFDINPSGVLKLLKNEEAHFDSVLPCTCTDFFFNFLFDNPNAYNVLSELNKAHVDNEIEKSLDFKFLSWFKFDSMADYHEFIIKEINDASSFYISMDIVNKLKDL